MFPYSFDMADPFVQALLRLETAGYRSRFLYFNGDRDNSGRLGGDMDAVGPKEINRILAVTDEIGRQFGFLSAPRG